MLLTSLARGANALGSIIVEVEEVDYIVTSSMSLRLSWAKTNKPKLQSIKPIILFSRNRAET